MPSEVGSSAHGRPSPSRAKNVGYNDHNQPLQGWGRLLETWTPTTTLAKKNAIILGNNANPNFIQRVDPLAVVIVQIAAIVTQANRVLVPPMVEQLGVQIPQRVIPQPVGLNRNGAPSGSHYTRYTQNESQYLEGSHTKTQVSRHTKASSCLGVNDEPHDVDEHFENYSHWGNRHNLRDDLNAHLCLWDMRDRLNDHRA